MYLENAGSNAISITKPGDSVIFGWSGCDSEHFLFVIDDDMIDDRERPIAFWPIDGRAETGLIANSFPEFLEWLVTSYGADSLGAEESERLLSLLKREFGIHRLRSPKKIVATARAIRFKKRGMTPTRDNIGVLLPEKSVDRKYLDRISWPSDNDYSVRPQPALLDEADRRLEAGELGTALVLARNYRFHWWYDDWKTARQIIRRTSDLLTRAYGELGRPAAATEIERQTEWNLSNVL
jgi:hypothetical protein